MTDTETAIKYDECINLLHKTVWEFIQHMGISYKEYDELFSQSNLYFMLACQSYDGQTKFSTWLRTQIWFRLFKEHTKQRTYHSRLYSHHVVKPQSYYHFFLTDLLDELGQDGLALVTLVRNGELDVEVALKGYRSGMKAVFTFLRNRGWTRVQIHRSFKEIAQLLRE